MQQAIEVEGLETELVVEGQVILAGIYFLLGDLETAQQEVTHSMEEARRHELTRMLARSQCLLGSILAAQERYDEADGYFEQALEIFREHELRLDYARALHGYGETLLKRSAPGTYLHRNGLTTLHKAQTIFAECHAAIDLEWVKQSLANGESETVNV